MIKLLVISDPRFNRHGSHIGIRLALNLVDSILPMVNIARGDLLPPCARKDEGETNGGDARVEIVAPPCYMLNPDPQEEADVISSSGVNGAEVSHGIEIGIRAFSGARGVRVIGGGNTVVGEHSHDWPVLSLYVMGDYRKTFDGGEASISGPSVVLHGAGEAHANQLHGVGLEQIDLQFDPCWLCAETANCQLDGVQYWIGGQVAAAGAQLASLWSSPDSSEQELADATGRLIRFALGSADERRPIWLEGVLQRLHIDTPATASELARPFGLHPSWLAQAYRAAMGEGIRQTLQRRRVEYATTLLRGSNMALAAIAAEAGFCDQSHMIRAFRKLLGRTPTQVRAERSSLAASAVNCGDIRRT